MGDGGGGYSPTCVVATRVVVVVVVVVVRVEGCQYLIRRFISHTCRRHNIFPELLSSVMPS